MKTNNPVIYGVIIILFLISCRKMDTYQDAQTPGVTSVNKVIQSAWMNLGNWQSNELNNETVYSNEITDTNINSDIISSGLVLVYERTANVIEALPVEKNGSSGKALLYYQVTVNKIILTEKGEGMESLRNANINFAYFILPAEQLNELSNKGYSTDKLLQMPYEGVAEVVKME